MKSILISLLWKVVSSLIGHGLGKYVLSLVKEAAGLSGMAGEDRRVWVKEKLAELQRIGVLAIVDVSESFVNLAIEAAVAKTKTAK